MSFFARASWPGDHRDEVVAGALAAAVIVVLGYASGIGAPAPRSVDTAAPPATTAPADPPASNSAGSAVPPATSAGAGAGGGTGSLPVGDAPPVTGGTGAGEHGGHNGKEGGGDSTEPSRTPPESPSPNPSPAPSDSCDDGQVRLVQPLLSGANDAVTGLLDGLPIAASPSPSLSPSPSPSPSTSPMSAMSDGALCLGVRPPISLFSGLTS
jgi:hypothetical protein